jgi:dihydrofolate reductase
VIGRTQGGSVRKLKLQAQVSMDGYVAGPDGELDWMTWNWDDKLKEYVTALTAPVGTILLGRKMTDGFVKHWESVAARPDDPEVASARKFVDTPKVVFTKTLDKSPWKNTVLAKGNLASEVGKLKAQTSGGDIIVYGGASFVSSLVEEGLIDEYHLFVNPSAIGKGLGIFGGLAQQRKFALKQATPFACGIAVLQYERA